MRKFEAELPNDLWQSDCMHGPKIKIGGILKKTFLFAFIDDHSRIIPHAEFYLQENLDNYLKCLKIAINKRGLPRKLYVDNGPSFRSLKLEYITASLSIALLHAKPYRPEGKGKIERWFKTVQVNFIPSIFSPLSLAELNLLLQEWIDKEYHIRKHSSTKEAPLERYIRQIQLIRKSPTDIDKYFRNQIKRKVAKDRTISFKGKLYEAPVELIGKYVFLFYDEDDLNNIEIYYNKKSYGKLVVLNPHINYKVSRNNHVLGFTLKKEKHITEVSAAQDYQLKTGQLFERGEN